MGNYYAKKKKILFIFNIIKALYDIKKNQDNLYLIIKKFDLKEYIDYHEALKIKNHLSYKLGNAIVLSFKYWYKGRLLKLPFELVSIYKKHKRTKR